jgi:O-methyltransferase
MPNIRFRQAVELKAPVDLIQTWQRFQQFSMIPREHFVENLQLIQQLGCRLDGAFVECGTWKGGMAAAMMAVGGANRQYHFFDSFQGLPPAQQIDGAAALRYQRNVDAPDYYDNCTANYDEFMALMATVSPSSANLHVHRGWFADTVPLYDGPDIAVLRLDGDWYESTMACLTHLYPRVQTGGVVIIDDYEAWTGCSRAVHQYLTEIQSSSVINRTAFARVPYLIKDEISSQVDSSDARPL